MKKSSLTIFLVFCLLVKESISRPKLRHIHKTFNQCSKCPPGWGVLKSCTTYSKTQCEKCEPGKTYSPHHSYHSTCWTCSKCGVGLYEAHKCSVTRDTVCDDCTRILSQPNILKNNDFTEKCSYMYMD